MNPRKEQIGDCTLYCGRAEDVLPSLPKVDALICDPPYGLGDKWQGGGGGKKSRWVFHPSEAHSWDGETCDIIYDAIPLASHIIIWGGNYYKLPPSRCWLVWDKCQPDTWTTGQCELAWTNLDRPVRAFRMCQAVAHSEMVNKVHPTQKPLSLMLWCFKWLPRCETVLDCFAGSGTTVVAAVKLGMSAIAIEQDLKYFDVMCRRVEDAYTNQRLFANLPPEPTYTQADMFAEVA